MRTGTATAAPLTVAASSRSCSERRSRRTVGARRRARAGRRRAARGAGVADRCEFSERPTAPVDVVISVDGFEPFDDPGGVLRLMAGTLKPARRGVAPLG